MTPTSFIRFCWMSWLIFALVLGVELIVALNTAALAPKSSTFVGTLVDWVTAMVPAIASMTPEADNLSDRRFYFALAFLTVPIKAIPFYCLLRIDRSNIYGWLIRADRGATRLRPTRFSLVLVIVMACLFWWGSTTMDPVEDLNDRFAPDSMQVKATLLMGGRYGMWFVWSVLHTSLALAAMSALVVFLMIERFGNGGTDAQ